MKQRDKFFWLKANFKDDGSDEDGAGGGAGGKGDATTPNPEFEKLVEGMGALAKGMEGLQASQAATAERLAELDAAGKQKQNLDEGDGDDGDDFLGNSSEDIERLSRTEFANKIIDRVVKAVDKQMKTVAEQVDGVRKDAGNTALELEIEKMEDKHKDFWEWQPEIKALAKENPGTSIKRLYTMARGENPEKLADLDKKYKSDENDGKGGDAPKKGKFGGLTPTSSVTEPTDKMDKKSAADKAFDDTMGDIPSVANS